ncbi:MULTISPECIES: DUF6801 domain-containing protein [Streptomyces]|uniref:DUF6801 domain-containing protein n=2 Tax=Streptomyces TaxID=1883 RepID=A0ABU4KGC3_9ACTN|nr:DUF6801 domain-containing protein [Streptomyces roseolus]MDX2296838.1 DUF6801 domain-containing protein [Streptomyces roseolus]
MRGATIAAFVALAPLLPAAAVAVGTLKVDAALPYVCTLPSGARPATVRVTAAFPERAAVGEEIRPTDVTTTVELPPEAVADLTALGAATVRAETRLTVGVAQHERRAEVVWSGTAEPVAVPSEGPLTLATSGEVPTLTTDSAGELALAAGGLALDLAPSTADGAATTPTSLSVVCVPGPDAEGRTELARVPVGTGEPGTPPATPAPPTSPVPSTPAAPSAPSPSSGLPLPPRPSDRTPPAGTGTPDGTVPLPGPKTPDAGPRTGRGLTPADEPSPGTQELRPPVPPCVTEKPTPLSLSAYITGYANVRKLNGASLVPETCVLLEQGLPQFEVRPDGSMHVVTPAEGNLYHHGREETPPFEATFLTFGFAPTKATLVLEQSGPLTVVSDVLLIFPTNILTTHVRVPLTLRVLDVEVNGTRLDVGPSCRTERPLSSPEPEPAKYPGDHLVLVGKGSQTLPDPPVGYILTGGGPLTGEVTIPAFTGCGTGGEDLDRLLTAAISGPGNHIKQMQGSTCSVGVESPPMEFCTQDLQPRQVPKPER